MNLKYIFTSRIIEYDFIKISNRYFLASVIQIIKKHYTAQKHNFMACMRQITISVPKRPSPVKYIMNINCIQKIVKN